MKSLLPPGTFNHLRPVKPRRCVWREGGKTSGKQCQAVVQIVAHSQEAVCHDHKIRWTYMSPRKKQALREVAEK